MKKKKIAFNTSLEECYYKNTQNEAIKNGY